MEYFKLLHFDFTKEVEGFDNIPVYVLLNIFTQSDAHPTEMAFRFFYDNDYITKDDLLDREDGDALSIAYILSNRGYDLTYVNSLQVMEAIREDEDRVDM